MAAIPVQSFPAPILGGMPLTVYADVFVIVNLYIDFFLLWCVRRFLGLRAKSWRLVAGSLLGALCALVSLAPLPAGVLLLAGGAAALAAAAGAFCPLPWQQLLRAWLGLWVFSFLLAGFFLFLIRFFAPGNIAVFGSAVYLDLSLPLLFLFTCGAYGAFWLFQRLFPRDSAGARLCTLCVENRGRRVEVTAKADTGNALREPFSGLPVVVCEADALGGAAPPGAWGFLTEGAAPPAAGQLRLVPFESLGGGGVLPAFRPDRVTEKKTGRELACYVALYRQKLSAGTFSALYNPDQFPTAREQPPARKPAFSLKPLLGGAILAPPRLWVASAWRTPPTAFAGRGRGPCQLARQRAGPRPACPITNHGGAALCYCNFSETCVPAWRP